MLWPKLCLSKIHILNPYPPIPPNVTIFGDKVFKESTTLKVIKVGPCLMLLMSLCIDMIKTYILRENRGKSPEEDKSSARQGGEFKKKKTVLPPL